MVNITALKDKVLAGYLLDKEEIYQLVDADLESLCEAANEIRKQFCGNAFDICTIINGKSGKCSENCKFCAQSAHHNTEVATYPLLGTRELVEQAKYNEERGVRRYSIVTSGKKLSDDEVDRICESVKEIKKTGVRVCGSFGLLDKDAFSKLKEAGVTRVHNNLETSRNYFENVCTTHTYEDKIQAIEAAKTAGVEVCSGGIMGLGETMEDRIDMVYELRELGVRSIPVNMLNAIPGTPLEQNQRLTNADMRRIVAIFRFIIPDAFIRLAGGRGLLEDKGRSCFQSGANAAISGDMLTTQGITIETDFKMLKELNYEVV